MSDTPDDPTKHLNDAPFLRTLAHWIVDDDPVVRRLNVIADRIEELERANGILLRKTELHECPWCGYYGTHDGLPPEDGTP